MVWTNDMRISVVEVHTVGMASAEVIGGISTSRIEGNPEVTHELTAGNIYAGTATLETVRPVASFTTFSLAQAIAVLGLVGKCVESDVSHPGINLYAQKQTCTGPSAGATNRLYNVKTGLLVPRTLTVDHRGNAQLSYDLLARYDGVNNPVTKTDSVSIPASADNDDRWTMHTMVAASVAVEGKRQITINFNAQTTSEGADSVPYDTVQSLSGLLQQIQVQGVDPEWFDTVFDLVGKSATHANTAIVLRKRHTPNATAEHIELTANGLIVPGTLIDGSPTSPATTSFSMNLTYDGANAPIVADVAFAIP